MIKSFFFTTTFIFLAIATSLSFTFSWSYPVQDIFPKTCAVQEDSDCKYPLPIIEDANYQKYRYNRDYRKVYTMLQGTTYFDGRDLGIGSHQGIDIASAAGTPINTIQNGTVIIAEYRGGRGRVITIEHTTNDEQEKIYSSYAHLQEVLVSPGQKVTEGEIIALMGSSGNSSGPHLHFQIEKEGDHPFFFKNCIGEISQIVNEGRCQSQMYEQTVDPILFIEKNGNIPLSYHPETTTDTSNDTNDIYNIDSSFSFSGFLGGVITLEDTKDFLVINNATTPQIIDTIQFQNTDQKIDVFPTSIEVLTKERKVFLTAKQTGFSNIQVEYNQNKTHLPVFVTEEQKYIPTLPTLQIPNPFQKDAMIVLIKRDEVQEKIGEEIILEESYIITMLSTANTFISKDFRTPGTSLKTWLEAPLKRQQIISKKGDSLNNKFMLFQIEKKGATQAQVYLFKNEKIIGKINL